MSSRQDLVKLKSAITIEKYSPKDHVIEDIITSDPSKPQSMISQPIVGAKYTYEEVVEKEKKSKKVTKEDKGSFLGKKGK